MASPGQLVRRVLGYSASGYIDINGSIVPIQRAVIDGGSHDVVAAVAGKKIRVISWRWTIDVAGTVTWQSGATTDLTGAMPIGATAGCVDRDPDGIIETAAGEKLNVVLATATAIGGSLNYIEV